MAAWVIYAWVNYKPVEEDFMGKFNLNVTRLSKGHLHLKHFLQSFLHRSNFRVAETLSVFHSKPKHWSFLPSLRWMGHSYRQNKREWSFNSILDFGEERRLFGHVLWSLSSFMSSLTSVAGEHYECTAWTEVNKSVIYTLFPLHQSTDMLCNLLYLCTSPGMGKLLSDRWNGCRRMNVGIIFLLIAIFPALKSYLESEWKQPPDRQKDIKPEKPQLEDRMA